MENTIKWSAFDWVKNGGKNYLSTLFHFLRTSIKLKCEYVGILVCKILMGKKV